MEEKTKKLYAYHNQYKKEHLESFGIRFRNEEDKDILEKFKTVSNRSQYIKQLIKDDLSKK